MKKILTVVALLSCLLVFGLSPIAPHQVSTTKVEAATTVNPPWGVGTYNDFGQVISLTINPMYSNAAQFRIEYAPGYNATTGFTSYTISAATNYYYNRTYYCKTGFIVPTMGWWTIHVVSIGSDGTEAAPFVTNVNVTR